MYKTFQAGTGWFVEIKDSTTPEGIVNAIPISAPRTPQNFLFSHEGWNWIEFDLLTAVTGGIYRYANSSHLTGHFVTNILCSSVAEARERFNLPLWNPADTKAKVQVEPTTVIIGYFSGTQDVQMYVADSSKLISIGSTATDASW